MKLFSLLCPLLAAALCLAAPFSHAQTALHVDTAGNPTAPLNLSGSNIVGGSSVVNGQDINPSSIGIGTPGPAVFTSLSTRSGVTNIKGSAVDQTQRILGIANGNNTLVGSMDGAGNLTVAGTVNGITLTATPPPVLTNGLLAEYRFDEGAGRTALNHTGQAPLNFLACPEGPFNQPSFWNGGTNVTDRFALPPFGVGGATRWNQAGYQQLNQTVTVAAGTYTLSIYVASNTGAAQKVATVLNGAVSADVTVPATGWIRIVRSVTYSSAGTDAISILYTDSSHDPNDLLFYGVQFEPGSTASDYVPNAGLMTFVGAPSWIAGGVSLASGTSFLGASLSRQNIAAMTVYCVMQWPTASAAPSANVALLGDVQPANGYAGYYLCAQNGVETYPNWTMGGQTATAPLCNVHDGNWHLVAASSDGTTLRMFIDDVEVGDASLASSIFQTTILEVGNLSPTGYNFPGSIGYVSVYNVAHSGAQHAAQFAAIQGIMAAKGVTLSVLPALVDFEGDSITAGLGGTTIFPVTVMAALTPIVQGRNFAVPGDQVTDLTARAATVDAQVSSSRARNVLSVLIGHNDLVAGETAATFVAALKTYCLARRAAGWNRIVVGTLLPSTASGFNTTRAAANTLIRADPSFYDRLADYDTNATIGADSAAASTTYYIDGTHPTTAGYNLMAPITQAAVAAAMQ